MEEIGVENPVELGPKEGESITDHEEQVEDQPLTAKQILLNSWNDIVLTLHGTNWKDMVVTGLKTPRVWIALIVLIIVETCLGVYNVDAVWHMLFLYGWVFISTTPINNDPVSFFKGRSTSGKRTVGYFTLTSSAFIAWIFAKSITNSANLGYSYGFVGGIGYAVYYLSFWVAAFVIYRVRVVFKYHNLAHALEDRYGKPAALVFGLTVTIRLYNEIWSNAAVVGGYFGSVSGTNWWTACIIATAIPLIYILMGGVRTSVISDAMQSFLTITLLIIVLAEVVPKGQDLGTHFVNEGTWDMAHGADFIVLAFVQIWSYPFHDPVLTDHGFLTKPKVMVASFITAGVIAGAIIMLFSFVGIYGAVAGLSSGDPPVVAASLSPTIFNVIALLMMSSSISVVDSTYSSTARLIGLQVLGWITKGRVIKPEETNKRNILAGRIAMVVMAIIGLLPLVADPSVLAATTVSGSMVIGLAPCFLLMGFTKKGKQYPLSFQMSFWSGAIIGIVQVANKLPSSWNIGTGAYANILGANIYGSIICWGLFCVGLLFPADMIMSVYERFTKK